MELLNKSTNEHTNKHINNLYHYIKLSKINKYENTMF